MVSCHTQKFHPTDWKPLKTLNGPWFSKAYLWFGVFLSINTLLLQIDENLFLFRRFLYFYFHGINNFLPLTLLHHFFPQENKTFHIKHFLIPFFGTTLMISLCELTQIWNYHTFIYTFVILFHSSLGCIHSVYQLSQEACLLTRPQL